MNGGGVEVSVHFHNVRKSFLKSPSFKIASETSYLRLFLKLMLPISNAKKFQWDIFGDFHTVVFFRPLNGTRHSTAAAEKSLNERMEVFIALEMKSNISWSGRVE